MATNKVVARSSSADRVPGPNWLADGLGSIWVDIPNNSTIVRIDPVTDLSRQRLPRQPSSRHAAALRLVRMPYGWSGCDASAAVARIDPVTNTSVTAVALPGHGGPTLIGDMPWVSLDMGDEASGLLVRINPATNTIDRALLPDVQFGGGGGITVVGDSVWVQDYYHRVLLRFPLATFGA